MSYDKEQFEDNLNLLKLKYTAENYQAHIEQAVNDKLAYFDLLTSLIEGEVLCKKQRIIESRLKKARFPAEKTLQQFRWEHPGKINEQQVKQLFTLQFIERNANVMFIGGCGVGKTHLSIALAREACLQGHTVLFTTAVDIINSLTAARQAGRLIKELRKYTTPRILVIDEIGFLPIDKLGADLLFQVISKRYEKGPIILSSNRAFKDWKEVFNNDATLASAILDRLLHHSKVVVIEGESYRMKNAD